MLVLLMVSKFIKFCEDRFTFRASKYSLGWRYHILRQKLTITRPVVDLWEVVTSIGNWPTDSVS